MGLDPDAVSGHMAFYTSSDLKKWECQSMQDEDDGGVDFRFYLDHAIWEGFVKNLRLASAATSRPHRRDRPRHARRR